MALSRSVVTPRGTVRLATAVLATATSAALLVPASPASAHPAPRPVTHYTSCTALNHVYPFGVGLPGAQDSTWSSRPVSNFSASTAIYRANNNRNASTGEHDLDGDDDGIACEKRFPRAALAYHGGEFYGVYLSVTSSKGTRYYSAKQHARAAGYGSKLYYGDMQLGCDQGAAERLGKDPDAVYHVVNLYFSSRARADAFVAAYAPRVAGVARVTTLCMD